MRARLSRRPWYRVPLEANVRRRGCRGSAFEIGQWCDAERATWQAPGIELAQPRISTGRFLYAKSFCAVEVVIRETPRRMSYATWPGARLKRAPEPPHNHDQDVDGMWRGGDRSQR